MTAIQYIKRHPKRWGAVSAVIAAVAVGGSFVGWNESHAEGAGGKGAPQAVPVSVATVVQKEVSFWDEFSGRLEAVQHVDIRARVSGAVQSVHFKEGTLVKKGDLLVTVDPAPYAAEVDRAQAQLAAAQARVQYSRSEWERATRLLQENAIAQREYDERNNAFLEAQANVHAAQAAQKSARLNLSYTQVRAPISGRVGRIEVTVGNLVAAGPSAPVLTTLVSVSPIYASFDADERTVTNAIQEMRAENGTRLQVERVPVQMGIGSSGGTPFAGHLQWIDNQVDSKSGTVRLRAVFDNKDGVLMPGQFARIRMGQTKNEQALLINERAVGTDQSKKFVMVLQGDNTVAYREVTLGASIDGLRTVTSGLKAGETIVVGGLQRIRPGASVAPQTLPMDTKAELVNERKQPQGKTETPAS